jgi:uncharacterized protein
MRTLRYKAVTIEDDAGYTVSDGRTHLLYFPLQSHIFEISDRAYDAFESDNTPATLSESIADGLRSSTTRVLPIAGSRRANNVLGIALSNGCNLACVYCHADAGELTSSIDDAMAKSAIEFVVRKCAEERKGFLLVIIGAGEPTFTWNKLVRVVENAKLACAQECVKFQAIMSTNGVLGDTKRGYITQNFSQISLSLDGPADIQDENRPTRGKDGSFSAAFASAKYFHTHNVPFGIRSTVSASQAARLPEIYKFFKDHFPETHVAFEPVIPMGRGFGAANLEDGMWEFVEGFAEIIRHHGREGFSYSGVTFGRVTNQFCGPISGAQFNLATDGTLQACSRIGSSSDFVYGKFQPTTGGFEIDECRRTAIACISVDDYEDCQRCFAKFNCAGDCPDMRSRKSLRCDANRAILWYYLLEEARRGDLL